MWIGIEASGLIDPSLRALLNRRVASLTAALIAAEADSSQELYGVLRSMIASLNDPHTRVFAPDEKSDWWRPRFVSVGFAIAEIAGLPTATGFGGGLAGIQAMR
ncbi:MAG: hypothetical protein ABJA18_02700 [bacterium]